MKLKKDKSILLLVTVLKNQSPMQFLPDSMKLEKEEECALTSSEEFINPNSLLKKKMEQVGQAFEAIEDRFEELEDKISEDFPAFGDLMDELRRGDGKRPPHRPDGPEDEEEREKDLMDPKTKTKKKEKED